MRSMHVVSQHFHPTMFRRPLLLSAFGRTGLSSISGETRASDIDVGLSCTRNLAVGPASLTIFVLVRGAKRV